MKTSDVDALDQFDVIQLSLTGLSGVVRKQYIASNKLKDILEKSGVVHFGNVNNDGSSLLYDRESCSGEATVVLSTLRALPWSTSQAGQTVGGAVCELMPSKHDPTVNYSPRAAAQRQIKRLREEFGLTLKSTFEVEFMIFEKDEVTPFNNVHIEPFARVDNMAGREDALLGACYLMELAGLPLYTFQTEFTAAQFELTFQPEEGVSSADSVITMREATRCSLGKDNLVTTYMATPLEKGLNNGLHFNHSLWAADGQSVLYDSDDPLKMSDTARHWIAGLIHHAPALTPLTNPTINCFRRLENYWTPTLATWGVENRLCFLRLKNANHDTYVENRLPSGISNPYLNIAAVLAAGMDGLARKLTCPPQCDPTAPVLPCIPEDALKALEQDTILKDALGKDFVNEFQNLFERGLSLKKKGAHNLDVERDLYLQTI